MSDPHGAVGAYVADALEQDEREVFEQHLRICESCRREVTEFAETAAELTRLTETAPPPALRTSLLAEIATVRPLPPEHPGQAAADEIEPTAPTLVTAPNGEDDSDGKPIDELAARRKRRTRRLLTGLVAAALVLVVGLGGWVSVLTSQQRGQQVASQQVNDLLTAPDAKVYPTELDGAPVSFVVSKDRDQALFVGHDVAAPEAGKVYQLWMIDGAQVTPNATIDQGGTVTQWFDPGPLDGAQQLAVTVEPTGGSLTPNLPPVAGVKL
ncbi:MAG: anti-sigma factor [Microlunatus sp.]|nr:anti-sigma factor [Microlunatus sp.]